MTNSHPKARLFGFARNEDGSATIETVLWLPFFVALFALIADASLMFNAQASLTRTVQDANRAYSVGILESETEAESYVLARIGADASADADTTIQTTVADGIISTTVSVEAGHFTAIGVFNTFTDLRLTVQAQHMMES